MFLLLEAERQGLMNGDYVFFLVQHFEVSGGVVSKNFQLKTVHFWLCVHGHVISHCSFINVFQEQRKSWKCFHTAVFIITIYLFLFLCVWHLL